MIDLSEKCPEFAEILTHSSDSIYLKDMEGRFELVSEAKARNSGVSWREMIGKTDFDFMPIEEAGRCAEDDEHIIRTGDSIVDREEERTRPDGTRYWVSASKFPRRDAEGQIVGTGGISRDISERKAMEKYVLQLLSSASHDIRGPLVATEAVVKCLIRELYGPVDASVKETLEEVFQRLHSLEGIVVQYLSKSAVMGLQVTAKEKLDLRQDIIDPVINDLSVDIRDKRILIDNTLGCIPGNRIFVRASKSWLSIVYRNLISNAVHHTPSGGTIALGFEERQDAYLLNVYSSSPPIADIDKEKIFQPFVSVHSTGLGLYFSRDIVEKHGGNLWCENALDGHPNMVFTLKK